MLYDRSTHLAVNQLPTGATYQLSDQFTKRRRPQQHYHSVAVASILHIENVVPSPHVGSFPILTDRNKILMLRIGS